MNHGMAYTPPLYCPVAIWPWKYALVSGLNWARLASQPDCANWDGQITSEVITSGVADPEVKRCVSCSNATSAVGDRLRICTVMLGCSFSNAFTAVVVAVPSEPRPCVANTIVCLALADTWLPAPEPELPQPAAAKATAALMAAASTVTRPPGTGVRPGPDLITALGQYRMMDASFRFPRRGFRWQHPGNRTSHVTPAAYMRVIQPC